MKWHDHCRFMELPREYPVVELARFHGHLGPFIVLGYRMGKYALSHLTNDPFSLNASVYCSGKTPQSCIVDGIQLGSGCTLGKGNIGIIVSEQVFCDFSGNGKKIRITPLEMRKIPENGPDYELEIEKYAEELYNSPDSHLFSIEDLS